MATQQVIHMNSGMGDESYALNSFFQKKMMMKAKPILEESITICYYNILPKYLKIADLGCSSGPNALLVVSNIINIVVDTISSNNLNLNLPDFQFYLNDLFGNDFNTIFKSLPQFYKTLSEEMGHEIGSCFINATPGTFYERLYPSSSIHFFHSSYSLHWLSQAPEKLIIEGEEALKWDSIYLTRTSCVSMHKAYLEQFQRDFKKFLRSRSEELVAGGGMLLTFLGSDEDTSEMRTTWELIDMSLKDLLLENLIEKATLECFTMPNYDPSMEEVKQVIEEEGSFILHKLETIYQDWDANMNGSTNDNNNKVDENMRGKIVPKYLRAVTEPLLKAHFGEFIMDELFLRLENKVVQLVKEIKVFKFPTLAISLIKNA